MSQQRKKPARRAPTHAKKPAPAPAVPRAKRSRSKEPARLVPSERSAGPVNPDSMSAEVIEFITAIDEYKRKQARPFPSWSEILEIVKGLGYQKAG